MHTPSITMRPVPTARPRSQPPRRASRADASLDDASPDEIRQERRAIVGLLVIIALATALVQTTSQRARATHLPTPRADVAMPATTAPTPALPTAR